MERMKLIGAVLLLCLMVTACGKEEQAESVEREFAVSGTASIASASGLTLEEYVSAKNAGLSAYYDVMQGYGMDFALEARDKSLVYHYQYTVELENADMAQSRLEIYMNGSQGEVEYIEGYGYVSYGHMVGIRQQLEGMLGQLKKVVPEAESVIVEYLDCHGDMIYSTEIVPSES